MEQEHGTSKRLAGHMLWGVFGLALAIVIGAGVVVLWRAQAPRHAPDDLRPFATVPDFALRERSGSLVRRGDLWGKVWIADFIFTRCSDECPLVSARMARLQEVFATATDVYFVSITVDPEHDTPEVLSRYAESFGAHPQRWLFLTGDRAAIYRLAQEGFRLGVVSPGEAHQSSAVPFRLQIFAPRMAWAHHGSHDQEQPRPKILHSARFVLVDRQGQIRQYYDSNDENSLRRLPEHVKRLLQERLL
ncbi:MAG TPA: SCO family protein [Candidatus Tectomicrobia bacterium]